jgi:beta-lactamase class A
MWNDLQPGTVIAGVPVGGLSRQEASDRLIQIYGSPVELHYQKAVIQIDPVGMGFKMDETAMLDAAEVQRGDLSFWGSFWAFLWGTLARPKEVPMIAVTSQSRIRQYLQTEIVSRYDQPTIPMMPQIGDTWFVPGVAGVNLDIDDAVVLIQNALCSPTQRVVTLQYTRPTIQRPSLSILSTMLKQVIYVDGFDGYAEVYLKDLKSGEEFDFATKNREDLPPDIAFTAASTMKIPIMVTVFQRVKEPTPQAIADQLDLVFRYSENPPADWLLQTVVDRNLGPLGVSDDMQALGLKNTFLAGYFYQGAPLLRRYQTPANSRKDVATGPDVYNQTTAADMGALLDDIYECSQYGGGALMAVFHGEISQSECKQMVYYLELDKIGVLIQGGLPDGAVIAHKHGWITEGDGFIHTVGDAGIIYSPGGDYILSIYMNHPTQLVWDSANLLVEELSLAVYNYYNQTP